MDLTPPRWIALALVVTAGLFAVSALGWFPGNPLPTALVALIAGLAALYDHRHG